MNVAKILNVKPKVSICFLASILGSSICNYQFLENISPSESMEIFKKHDAEYLTWFPMINFLSEL